MFEFDKEQKIVDRGWHDLFPGEKRTLIKRAKSSRRREERDSINSILKDPMGVLEDYIPAMDEGLADKDNFGASDFFIISEDELQRMLDDESFVPALDRPIA